MAAEFSVIRVTYVHQHYRHPRMAGGTRSHEFASYLAARGHHVTLIASWQEKDPPSCGVERIAGYEVRWIHVPYSNHMGFTRRVVAFIRFMVAASWHSSRTPADIVIATSTPLTVVVPGAISARIRRVPWVLEIRDLWPEVPIAIGALRNPVAKWAALVLERVGYRSATRVIALSPGMRDGAVRAGCDPNKVTVISNLANLEHFGESNASGERFLDRWPVLRGRPIVMYAGTLGRVNGVHYLVEIAAQAHLRKSTVAFCVIGDGSELQRIRRIAESMGVLDANLFVLPPHSKAEMPDALAAASLCTSLVIDLPAMWVNSANKFFDALAAGRPIAINHEGWQADLLRSTGAGIVLPAQAPSAAWAKIDEFLSDPRSVHAAGTRSRALAAERFDSKTLAADFERVLHNAIGS